MTDNQYTITQVLETCNVILFIIYLSFVVSVLVCTKKGISEDQPERGKLGWRSLYKKKHAGKAVGIPLVMDKTLIPFGAFVWRLLSRMKAMAGPLF